MVGKWLVLVVVPMVVVYEIASQSTELTSQLTSTLTSAVSIGRDPIIDFGTDKGEKRIFGHFTLFWLCVVSAIVVLIILACSVSCIFDLKNRRHKLPSEGEVSKRRKRKGKNKQAETKEAESKVPVVPAADYSDGLTSTARRSKRPTLVEKRRLVEKAAAHFSEMSSYSKDQSKEQEDKTQEETPPIVDAKPIGSAYVLDKQNENLQLDPTQRSMSGVGISKSSKRHRHRSKTSKRSRKSAPAASLAVNSTQPEGSESDSLSHSYSCDCSHPLSGGEHRSGTHKANESKQTPKPDKK
ncbi:hypothetical protein M3Y98_00562000 [Aphelenchoides besseyi]|nr:hypothetical protein M3Y98_00562000 [Aphelenchoides besseyi]KAI6193679.1 hypothetical protein M3Y96_01044300 [Aphelenchoides besseyi]